MLMPRSADKPEELEHGELRKQAEQSVSIGIRAIGGDTPAVRASTVTQSFVTCRQVALHQSVAACEAHVSKT